MTNNPGYESYQNL